MNEAQWAQRLADAGSRGLPDLLASLVRELLARARLTGMIFDGGEDRQVKPREFVREYSTRRGRSDQLPPPKGA
jgi:hypothetical protein